MLHQPPSVLLRRKNFLMLPFYPYAVALLHSFRRKKTRSAKIWKSIKHRKRLTLTALVVLVLIGSNGFTRGPYAGQREEDAEAHYSLGVTYAKQGRYAEGINELTKAIELNPDQGDAYYYLGVI